MPLKFIEVPMIYTIAVIFYELIFMRKSKEHTASHIASAGMVIASWLTWAIILLSGGN